jgi:hypothetical protein
MNLGKWAEAGGRQTATMIFPGFNLSKIAICSGNYPLGPECPLRVVELRKLVVRSEGDLGGA